MIFCCTYNRTAKCNSCETWDVEVLMLVSTQLQMLGMF